MNYEQIKQSLSLIQNPIDKLDMVMDNNVPVAIVKHLQPIW